MTDRLRPLRQADDGAWGPAVPLGYQGRGLDFEVRQPLARLRAGDRPWVVRRPEEAGAAEELALHRHPGPGPGRGALGGRALTGPWPSSGPGEHLWICLTIHRVDPERMRDPNHMTYLDSENILIGGAIGCYVYEGPYDLVKDIPCLGADHG